MTCLDPPIPSLNSCETLTQRLRRVIDLHFDPLHGSEFWLERASQLDVDALEEIRSPGDLARLGNMTPDDLRTRPLLDYIPRALHGCLDQFVIGQTGGTSCGYGTWTAYRQDEFCEAFVIPFIAAARYLGFPDCGQWLYVGPSGPHIIGKVVGHLANALGAPDPFSVDLDPRWARRLLTGSFSSNRYLQHVVDQAMGVIGSQDISVLFTMPVVLDALSQRMNDDQRQRILGVHYGGMAISPEQMRRFQAELFPNAVHLSGYGNTLFGCCLEIRSDLGRKLEYFPFGVRLLFDVIDIRGELSARGERGMVRFTRLDESMLIVRLVERDEAELIPGPGNVPEGFALTGVRDPRPPAQLETTLSAGLY